MTSQKQVEANRRNALKSTGPNTQHGKRRSRRNALKHGLAAETVVEAFEDRRDYKKFQNVIVSDYAPQSCVEHELVLRVASLLWRLRRATLIETGLLELQAQILNGRGYKNSPQYSADLHQVFGLRNDCVPNATKDRLRDVTVNAGSSNGPSFQGGGEAALHVAQTYLGLEKFDNGAFERIGHYEARLWRQLAQALIALDWMRQSLPRARTSPLEHYVRDRDHHERRQKRIY